MSTTRIVVGLAVLACFAAVGGCYVQSGPPTTAEAPVASPPPPPPPRAEPPPPPSPGADQQWVKGHYRWNGRSYDWQKGQYEKRPRANARYVPGHWDKRNGRQTWVSDHWQ